MALEGLGCRSVLENCIALAGPGVEREKGKDRSRCKHKENLGNTNSTGREET